MHPRRLASVLAASRKSVLLLGPRQVGKSTLMRALQPTLEINLAHEATYLEFARNPLELESRIDAIAGGSRRRALRTIFIDEIQRQPSLLNTIQSLLDQPHHGLRFLLTGSSARKLRRGEANLLPGRIHAYRMGPLTSAEMAYDIPTSTALMHGTLPGVLEESSVRDREKTLRSYAAIYLREEVQAESLTRSLEGFARFLTAIGEWAGAHLDLAKIATTAQVSRMSAGRWLEVLEDTLLVHRVDAFAKSATRRLVQHPKVFFFDVGVLNGLLGNFVASADRIGRLFEHLVYTQLVHSAAAFDDDVRVSTFAPSMAPRSTLSSSAELTCSRSKSKPRERWWRRTCGAWNGSPTTTASRIVPWCGTSGRSPSASATWTSCPGSRGSGSWDRE